MDQAHLPLGKFAAAARRRIAAIGIGMARRGGDSGRRVRPHRPRPM